MSPAAASQNRPTAQPVAPTKAAATVAAARAPASLVDDGLAKRDRDGMGARVCLELGEDVTNVALHGLLADEEPRGDVGVRHAVGEELQDLPLALREHLLALAREESGHQRRIDIALAARHLLDGPQERRVRRLLEDVALRPGLEPPAEQAALAVGGEDEHRGLRKTLAQDLRRLEPVHARHAD